MRFNSVVLLVTFLTAFTLQAASLHVLAWDQEIAGRELAIGSGAKSAPIVGMHHFARSQPIKISENAEGLNLLVMDRETEEGKPLAIALKIPAGVTTPLLLILPDKESPAGIKPLILDDSAAKFRWGTTRLVNVTGEVLVFRYEKKNLLVPAGWDPVTVSPGGQTRNIGVSIYLRKDLKQPPLYSSIWKHDEELRQLVFIVPSKDVERGFVDFKFITENRAVVAAQNENQQKEQQEQP
ncbi:MAG: hypothetical protein ACSHX9_13010 [Luteolibacter sp.]